MLLRPSQRAKSWENVFSISENGNYEKKKVSKVEGNRARFDNNIVEPPLVVTDATRTGNSSDNIITTKVGSQIMFIFRSFWF